MLEEACPTRSPFQRDRDRIVHSTAFRRLTHKTQVFVYHEGDHYRTRLTHTLEVAQIARTLARQLELDEDLAEAIALSHDLGHPPFGHAGERALDRSLRDRGGFDHNAQSLRVVTELEPKYANFDGLNLSFETLEGLVKHNGPLAGAAHPANASPIPEEILVFNRRYDLELSLYPYAEAQIAALADDIAYLNHDIDDGLRAGILHMDMLRDVPLTARHLDDIHASNRDLGGPRLVYELNRRLITEMINDLFAETSKRIAKLDPKSGEDIRRAGSPTAGFSAAMAEQQKELKAFLFDTVYRHERVMSRMRDAERVVEQLFQRFRERPGDMPDHWAEAAAAAAPERLDRIVTDFVAGMTDRYAVLQHQRLFDHTPDLG